MERTSRLLRAARALSILTLTALACLGTSTAFAQDVTSVAPTRLVRGTTTDVLLRGTDLGPVLDVLLDDDGVQLVQTSLDSDQQIRLRIAVGDRTSLGSRSLALVFPALPPDPEGSDDLEPGDDAPRVLPLAPLQIVPGPVTLISTSPTTAPPNTALTLTLRGTNLDEVTSASLGAGITVRAYSATSPVDASLEVTVDADAFSGPRALTLSTTEGPTSFPNQFTVAAGAATVSSLAPTTAVRATAVPVVFLGTSLDTVTAVSFGPRATVTGLTSPSPLRLEATVTFGDDAIAGPRDAVLTTPLGPLRLADAVSVVAGPPTLARIVPDAAMQGQTVLVTLDGQNLDRADSIDFGEGVTVVRQSLDFPRSISAELLVAPGATPGFRTPRVTTDAGPLEILDGFRVLPFVAPALRLRLPGDVQFPETQLYGLATATFGLENEGTTVERITIGPGTGDTDILGLVPTTGTPSPVALTEQLDFDLAPGEIRSVRVLFLPRLRGTFGLLLPIVARGEEQGTVTLRGRAIPERLRLNVDGLIDFGTVDANTPVRLDRVRTILAQGVEAGSVTLLQVELAIDEDTASAEDFDIAFQSTVAGATLFWGTTEIDITATLPAGIHRGTLLLHTNEPTARLLTRPFIIEATAAPDADTGPPPTDAGPDQDAASDAGPSNDIAPPPADAANDTAAPPDTSADGTAGDSGAPDTDAPVPPRTPRQSDGCASTGARPPTSALLLLLLVLPLRRRRTEA